MKIKPNIFFEPDRGIFHCEAANGQDYTLCGYTLDGDLGETPKVTGPGVKINCSDCVGIIRWCQKLSGRAVTSGNPS